MFGRYPFGGGSFGRSPSSLAQVLFGVIVTTSLRALDGVRRVLGLDGTRGMAEPGLRRRVLGQDAPRTMTPGSKNRVTH